MAGTLTISTLSDGTNSTSSTNCIQGSAKAWVNFNGTTSPGTIRAAYNVSSITKNGTGDYTLNFTNSMTDANYSTVTTAPSYNTGNFSAIAQVYGSATVGSPTLYSASQVRVCYGASTTLYDPVQLYVAVFR